MKSDLLKTDPSCMDDFDPKSLAVDLAMQKIRETISPLTDSVDIPVRDALDRVLAHAIHSPVSVPAAANSAMDGYAVTSADIPAEGTRQLTIAGTAWAGTPFDGKLVPGTCVRIMTGALIPAGADSVVIQENVQREGDTVLIDSRTSKGENVRKAGEDFAEGDLLLKAGGTLHPADIGLIASLGVGTVQVRRLPRVAFFSTGDELRSIGEPLPPGCIYDSNRYTLHAMLTRLGVEIIDMGVVRDRRELIEQAFLDAAGKADVIITSGGVSVGEADFVRETLNKLGKVEFWKIAMKPGRPLAFGKVRDALFFGLPGNPVSVMVTFYQFVQPALRYFMGSTDTTPLTVPIVCTSTLKKRPGRMEYQRGIMSRDNSGQLTVHKTGAQGSGILSSMSQANCFIILPVENDGVMAGDTVEVQPFYGLV